MQQWPIRQLTIMSTAPKRELRSCIAAFSSRCADVKRQSKRGEDAVLNHSRYFQWLIDGLCVFIYSSNLYAILKKCFAVISLILKSKPAEIYAQSLTEIQDLVKDNSIVQRIVKHDFSKLSGIIYFSKAFQIQLLFQIFHERMNPECDDRVRLSKSDKNIGAGG